MSVRRVWFIYTTVIGIGLLSFVIMITKAASPESILLGEWKEQSWEYEKVNKSDKDVTHFKQISDDVKDLLGENLIIHKAETWRFLPNGRLRLQGEDHSETATWRLKGRGHILLLKHPQKEVENYNIVLLNDTSLVINFDADMEVRGIAKLTFKKIKNLAN